jgi:hypothetical protein
MPHVLSMAALQFGNPVALLISMNPTIVCSAICRQS